MQRNNAAILQSGNLFMFVMHNPVRYVDPTGLFAIIPNFPNLLGPVGGGFGQGFVTSFMNQLTSNLVLLSAGNMGGPNNIDQVAMGEDAKGAGHKPAGSRPSSSTFSDGGGSSTVTTPPKVTPPKPPVPPAPAPPKPPLSDQLANSITGQGRQNQPAIAKSGGFIRKSPAQLEKMVSGNFHGSKGAKAAILRDLPGDIAKQVGKNPDIAVNRDGWIQVISTFYSGVSFDTALNIKWY